MKVSVSTGERLGLRERPRNETAPLGGRIVCSFVKFYSDHNSFTFGDYFLDRYLGNALYTKDYVKKVMLHFFLD